MRIALVNQAIPPTLNTAIIASTPSISIIDRPVWEIVLSPRFPHLSQFSNLFRESSLNILFFNNKANLLTKLVTRCHKILCTGNRMTGAENAGLVLSASFGVSLLLFLITPAKTR